MTSMLFIDSAVADQAALIAAAGPETEIFILDAGGDGIEQMREALQGKSGLASIQLLSHGSEGALYLGSARLDSGKVGDYAADLRAIGASLAAGGDLLLYGCKVAAGAAGEAFIAQLATATGADVAASTDLSGSAALGGNWRLEAVTGGIETVLLAPADYAGTLAVVAGTSGADSLTGTSGDDTLRGLAGDDSLDGGPGNDVALFSGTAADYRFDTADGALQVVDLDPADGDDGRDIVRGIETLRFADRALTVAAADAIGEIQVNTATAGGQIRPAVAALVDGGYVVTWGAFDVDGYWMGICLQRYSGDGNAVGDEIVVNTFVTRDQSNPSVAGLTGGGYVVTWQSVGQDGGGAGIYAQRYGAAGNAVGGEVRVNTTIAGDQRDSSVAGLDGGGYVIAWSSSNQDGSWGGIYTQRFDAAGNAVGGEARVNATTIGDQRLPAVAALDDGGYVVSWASEVQDMYGVPVYATFVQRFDAAGTAVGVETQVTNRTSIMPTVTSVAALAGGGYVVSLLGQSDVNGICAQRFDAFGNPVGSETPIETDDGNLQGDPVVMGLAGGGYVLSWEEFWRNGEEILGVYVQRFGVAGNPLGAATRVNTATAGAQALPAIAALADGSYVITWDASGDDGGVPGIFTQRYTAAGQAIGADLSGGPAADTLHGGSGRQLLRGKAGADTLDGGGGADTLVGGTGNDCYVVADIDDEITEGSTLASEIDTVEASLSWTLGANLEVLELTGGAAINASGNDRANLLIGNAAPNVLNGGLGNDTMVGGPGDDRYVVDSTGDVVRETSTLATDRDTVEASVSWALGANLENLKLIGTAALTGTGNALANTLAGNSGANVLDGGPGDDWLRGDLGNDIYLVDSARDVVYETTFSPSEIDTVRSSVNWTLGSLLENLVLTGTANIRGAGNEVANRINGNAGANFLHGGPSFGDDTIDGGRGNDTMIGGLGNDTYVVESAGDVVSEASTFATEIDTVRSSTSFSLGANVEIVVLVGTGAIDGAGNDLANRVTGNAGANVLEGGAGNDTIFGGQGNDTLLGGLGNDIYIIGVEAGAGDVVSETSVLATEIDTVKSSLSWTLGANVEQLVLVGTGAISGTGNGLANRLSGNAGANVLSGDIGDDTIMGGAGDDTMLGGLGNDTYVVDQAGDVVSETSTLVSEIDTESSSVSRTLGNNVENLVLIGTGAISGTGNGLANQVDGNAAANILSGGDGSDTLGGGNGSDTLLGGAGGDVLIGGDDRDILTGGWGADRFVFNAATETAPFMTAFDVITDFKAGEGDRIDVSNIDADQTIAGNQAFAILTVDAAFPLDIPRPGQLYYDPVTQLLFGNTNYDAYAEFVIQIAGVADLDAGDFIL